VRTLARLRRARALAVLCAGLALAATPAVARAESSGQAQDKVNAILAKVSKLQQQVESAEQQYDAALADVGASVNAAISDGRFSDQSAMFAQQQRDQLDDRIRALYMSGGPLAVYASLLDAQDPTSLEENAIVVEHVVAADQLLVRASNRASATAAAAASTADQQIATHIATERSVAQVALSVQSLLAEEQNLLGQAKAHVAALKAAEAELARQSADFSQITAERLAQLKVLPPSADFLRLYHRAAAEQCPGLSWTVLAAIGQVETGHGRDTSTSYAGAMGPMQFMPATFEAYAVDGDHDGVTDIMDPADAIFSAANYLCSNGAATGPNALANAIFLYNHADWYVQMVLTLAKLYAAGH
jgi:peptidoglycan hydrolase CwlO-like protein